MQSVTAQAQGVHPQEAAWHDLAVIPSSYGWLWVWPKTVCPFAIQQALA